MATMTTDDLMALRGQDVYGNDGDKIGSLEQIYIDYESGEPEWVAVKTGFFGSNVSLVPLAGAQAGDSDTLRVNHNKSKVKDAPDLEADGELSESDERQLYEYYGVDYRDVDPDSYEDRDATTSRDSTTSRDRSGSDSDRTMTLREEELKVGTRRKESGHVRLRKHVITEQQQVTVPVEKEVVRVEREPVTGGDRDAGDGSADLAEDDIEITLSEEEVHVTKDKVAKERVSLEKDVVTEEQTVTEDVSREEVEVDGDVDEGRTGTTDR